MIFLKLFFIFRELFENIISNLRDLEENCKRRREIACKAHVRIKHQSTHVDGKSIIKIKFHRILPTIDAAKTGTETKESLHFVPEQTII